MPDYGLSSQQLAVICALSSGAAMTTAAEQAGVHRNTIANWRRNSLPFQQGFAHAQYDRALYYREKIEDQVDLAIESLRAILADPKATPPTKLKAALLIVQTAITPPAPKKQVELDIEKIVAHRTPPETVTAEAFNPAPFEPKPEPPKDAQPEPEIEVKPSQPTANPDPPAEHKTAQPGTTTCEPSRPVAGKHTPRNARCPCGSGKKFKHCCINHPPLATAASP